MYNKEELKAATLTELREIAAKIKLDGYERLKKEYLVEEIIGKLEEKKELSKARAARAGECLNSAKILFAADDYKGAANRSYYAAFQQNVHTLQGL